MKKLAGLLVVMFFSFSQSGSTFTLTPLQVVTSPIGAYTGTPVPNPNLVIQPFGGTVDVFDIWTWQFTPCANGVVTATIYTPTGPVRANGVISQGSYSVNVNFTLPARPFNTTADVSGVCYSPSGTGATTQVPMTINQPGLQTTRNVPILM